MQDTGSATAALGLRRYLVQTGKYRPGDEDRLVKEGTSKPEWIGENFAVAVESILAEK